METETRYIWVVHGFNGKYSKYKIIKETPKTYIGIGQDESGYYSNWSQTLLKSSLFSLYFFSEKEAINKCISDVEAEKASLAVRNIKLNEMLRELESKKARLNG